MVALLLLVPREAYAYIDPGTGSMVFQVLIAILLGAGAAVHRFRVRIGGAFHRIFRSLRDRG